MDLTNKTELLNYLKQHNLWAKKGLSQNFLVDRIALDKIVEAAELKPDDFVIEIGPGLGTLTRELVQHAGEVVAVEMDEKLVELLIQQFKNNDQNDTVCHSRFSRESTIVDPRLHGDDKEGCGDDKGASGDDKKGCGCGDDREEGGDDKEEGGDDSKKDDNQGVMQINQFSGSRISPLRQGYEGQASLQSGMTVQSTLKIINDDILKVDLSELIGDRPYKVVANIPYHITSKILELFLSRENKPELIVLLVQKEVAERVSAKPGEMSVLAVSIQLYGKPEIVDIVKKESFFPSPKVDSAILKIVISCHSKLDLESRNYCIDSGSRAAVRNDNGGVAVRDDFDEKAFFRCVHIGFAARRKTLLNNLMVGYQLERGKVIDMLKSLELKETVRAQELSIEQWRILCRKMKKMSE